MQKIFTRILHFWHLDNNEYKNLHSHTMRKRVTHIAYDRSQNVFLKGAG